MFSEDTSTVLSVLQMGLLWFLGGVCFTKILQESPSLSTNKILAWIPVLQLWALADIGRVTVWSMFWRAMLSGLIIVAVFTGLAIASESVLVYFAGQILAGVAGAYFFLSPVTRQGKFPNASQLAMFAGVPIIGAFALIHIAWRGDWS